MDESKPVRPDQVAGQTGQPNFGEREFETGGDEYWKSHSQLNALNAKRTYDEYQDIAVTAARRSQSEFDQLNASRAKHASEMERLSVEAIQNAIENANMMAKKFMENSESLNKQHLAHRDIATDASWNPIQQGAADTLTGGAYPPNRAIDTATSGVAVSAEAVAAAVAKSVDASVTPLIAVISDLVKAISVKS